MSMTRPLTLRVMLMNGGSGVPGVTVSIDTTPGPTTAITDGFGNFVLSNIPNGTYTLTPSVTGASSLFFPGTQSVTVSGASVFNVNFQALVTYTVSGTVSYAGAEPGRVYLSLNGGNMGQGPGVSLAGPGAFTIRGVSPGTYVLNAWKDSLGQGMPNAANPAGTNASVVVGFANATGANVTLADPSPRR